MTVASLMQRLKSGGVVPPVTPSNPEKLDGVTAKNTPIQLFSLGKVPTVTPVTPVTSQKTVAKNKVAPPPDPGMAQLLALADRYCTAIQASDKTRQDWRSDIEATAPNDWQGLAAYLRGELEKLVPPVAPKPAPPAVVSPAATPAPAQTWRNADRADQLHYWSCTQCRTGPRCHEGQRLSNAYIEAAASEGRFIGAKPDPAQPLPKFHSAQPWNEADRPYQAHHWRCPTCKAASRSGHSERCATGQHLYNLYEQATMAGKNRHD